MIQLEKVIERGEQDIDRGNLRWFKFADGTYLMAGRCEFTTTELNTRFNFNLTLPISLTNPLKSACVVTNVYISRDICTWSATIMDSSTIRFDVEPADTTGAGTALVCSFVLLETSLSQKRIF